MLIGVLCEVVNVVAQANKGWGGTRGISSVGVFGVFKRRVTGTLGASKTAPFGGRGFEPQPGTRSGHREVVVKANWAPRKWEFWFSMVFSGFSTGLSGLIV